MENINCHSNQSSYPAGTTTTTKNNNNYSSPLHPDLKMLQVKYVKPSANWLQRRSRLKMLTTDDGRTSVYSLSQQRTFGSCELKHNTYNIILTNGVERVSVTCKYLIKKTHGDSSRNPTSMILWRNALSFLCQPWVSPCLAIPVGHFAQIFSGKPELN